MRAKCDMFHAQIAEATTRNKKLATEAKFLRGELAAERKKLQFKSVSSKATYAGPDALKMNLNNVKNELLRLERGRWCPPSRRLEQQQSRQCPTCLHFPRRTASPPLPGQTTPRQPWTSDPPDRTRGCNLNSQHTHHTCVRALGLLQPANQQANGQFLLPPSPPSVSPPSIFPQIAISLLRGENGLRGHLSRAISSWISALGVPLVAHHEQ